MIDLAVCGLCGRIQSIYTAGQTWPTSPSVGFAGEGRTVQPPVQHYTAPNNPTAIVTATEYTTHLLHPSDIRRQFLNTKTFIPRPVQCLGIRLAGGNGKTDTNICISSNQTRGLFGRGCRLLAVRTETPSGRTRARLHLQAARTCSLPVLRWKQLAQGLGTDAGSIERKG